jgi:hypothetical protein
MPEIEYRCVDSSAPQGVGKKGKLSFNPKPRTPSVFDDPKCLLHSNARLHEIWITGQDDEIVDVGLHDSTRIQSFFVNSMTNKPHFPNNW